MTANQALEEIWLKKDHQKSKVTQKEVANVQQEIPTVSPQQAISQQTVDEKKPVHIMEMTNPIVCSLKQSNQNKSHVRGVFKELRSFDVMQTE